MGRSRRRHVEQANRTGEARRGSDRRASPSATTERPSRPIRRFVFLFAVFALVFNGLYYAWLADTAAYDAYLGLNAVAAARVMQWLGTAARADGIQVIGQSFSLNVAQGCDAIQPAALYAFAVLAAPVAWRLKAVGLLAGVGLLLLLNLARIVTLYYFGAYAPAWFETMHIDVWQTAFIVLALLFWVVWGVWARNRFQPVPNVAA